MAIADRAPGMLCSLSVCYSVCSCARLGDSGGRVYLKTFRKRRTLSPYYEKYSQNEKIFQSSRDWICVSRDLSVREGVVLVQKAAGKQHNKEESCLFFLYSFGEKKRLLFVALFVLSSEREKNTHVYKMRTTSCTTTTSYASCSFRVRRKRTSTKRNSIRFFSTVSSSSSFERDDDDDAVATMERKSSGETSTSSSFTMTTTSVTLREDKEETKAVKTFKMRQGRHASFSAKKSGTVHVLEVSDPSRGLREYMSLPATSYSTLDGETVKRIDDCTFECTLGTLSFLGFKITPTVTAKVDVRPNGAGPMISVEEATISGSKIVEDANEQFQLSSVNDVSWFDSATEEFPNQKTIQSDTTVSVYLIVPRWFPFTVKSTERTGRFVVNQVVGQVVPRFLKQLKADYEVWSLGDDSRKAVCEGGLFDVDQSKSNPEMCDVSSKEEDEQD
ncbi:predicted protein [Bathycoccus prasinos]|uniref:Uncharacterized protein n=1 Tax=Bathycoccus prasinos TaxID=41875 RepID=K8EAC6_9CHLO|nr:predicted protein [Bathycoccus prasinos]CCO14686.1 predicted protein [Bathycoccus prasinos]|eukprot:XP_007515807.1 predicted protein [Bathycoccus prasinos]